MRAIALGFGFVLAACSGATTEATPASNGLPATANGQTDGGAEAAAATASCSETAGATWSLEKSRFAFGGTPVEDRPGHWTGPSGAGAAAASFAMFSLNGDSPDRNRPDFSGDSAVLQAHTKEYLIGFGIQDCQIANTQVFGSGGGGGPAGGPYTQTGGSSTIVLARVVDGIPVAESNAYARLDDQDKSTAESFLWPELPADIVAAAKALRTRLADPAELAAYKKKLPTTYEYQSDALAAAGVKIHHTLAFGAEPITFSVSWDTSTTGQMPVSFDADGKVIAVGGGRK